MARRLVNHRVFGYPHNQSKFAANYTYHVDTSRHFVYFEVNYVRVTPRQRSSFQISDWLVWQLRDCVRVFFHVECMRIKCKVEKLLARANKLPLKILNTVDDVEKHLMSLVAVNINTTSKQRTSQKLACFDSTTFVTLSSSSTLQSTLGRVQYMKNKITLQDQHQLRCPNNIAKLFLFA